MSFLLFTRILHRTTQKLNNVPNPTRQGFTRDRLKRRYVQKGYIRVTIQAKFLFDENSASLKSGAMDVLNRLAEVLQAKEGQSAEVTLVNEIENVANARDIDAERTLLVFSLVNFKRLAPETTPG